ncbi:hypothetical protein [Actinomyces minihominis]|uniref:hypothetical protein n=1 Tax=Actinomyces minihominis TaxID=2002838 RepID=UPI000C085663|nr:hypothetical protein [Actinomyces minihominis]
MKRLIAVDLARFLALVGMIAAHLLPTARSGGWVDYLTSGFPSTLFAVLGGFGVVFSTRRYLAEGLKVPAIVSGLVRGGSVALIGVLMGFLPDHNIIVILVYYGVAIMVATLLALVPQLPLLLLLLGASILTPLVAFEVKTRTTQSIAHGMLDFTTVSSTLTTLFLTGTYPVLTWSIYLGLGILLARALMTSVSPVRSALVSGLTGAAVWALAETVSRFRAHALSLQLEAEGYGTATDIVRSLNQSAYGSPFFGGWDALLVASPHSGSTADILKTGGAAVLVICLLVVLFSRATTTPILLRPLAKVGATPLTSYVLHITMTAFIILWTGLPLDALGWMRTYEILAVSFWWQLAVLLLLGTSLSISGKRGPLETLVSWAARSAARQVPPTQPEDASTRI